MPIDYSKAAKKYAQTKSKAPGAGVAGAAASQVVTAEPQKTAPPKKTSGTMKFLGSLAKGVADIALQPARFLERAGKGIGEIGLTPEQKARVEAVMGPGLQERVGGKEYATPGYESGKEAAGGAIQAAANLATPFVGGVGKLAAQGAALAGGKALEEDKSLGEAALAAGIGGATSAVIGKGMEVAGTAIGKGIKGLKQETKQILKPVAEKLAPYFTGTTRAEFNSAFNKHPELTHETLKIIQEAADPTEAEGVLRSRLIERARGIASAAKEAEESSFDDAINAVKAEFPDATGDIHGVVREFKKQLPKFGRPVSASERIALDSVKEIMQEPREYTIDGMRTLLSDLWDVASRTDQGTPARKAAMSAWTAVRKELSKTTKNKINPAMTAYSAFKDDMLEVAPVWSESVTEDSARNFIKNLGGTERTAALEALQRLGKRVGEDMTPDIIVNRIAKKLAVDQKITGSRLGEIIGAGTLYSAGGAVGELVGGEKGRKVAEGSAFLLGAHALAPSMLSKIILSDLDSQAVKMSPGVRAQVAKIFQDPVTWQIIVRLLQGGPEEPQE